MKRASLFGVLTLAACTSLQAQSAAPGVSEADRAALKQTALDYVEGWYEGSGERMARAVHPELAKRIVRTDQRTGKNLVQQMGASALIEGARAGGGKATAPERQQKDVVILDVFGNAAVVKATMSDWVDYMQMAKFDGRWVIVNVLWELKPKPQP